MDIRSGRSEIGVVCVAAFALVSLPIAIWVVTPPTPLRPSDKPTGNVRLLDERLVRMGGLPIATLDTIVEISDPEKAGRKEPYPVQIEIRNQIGGRRDTSVVTETPPTMGSQQMGQAKCVLSLQRRTGFGRWSTLIRYDLLSTINVGVDDVWSDTSMPLSKTRERYAWIVPSKGRYLAQFTYMVPGMDGMATSVSEPFWLDWPRP